MTAKKNIIKQLRQEIKDLQTQMTNYRHGMASRERQFTRIQQAHDRELLVINSRTNNMANTLQYRFNKDLTWLSLCDDPESKLQLVKRVIVELKDVAAPAEEIERG